MAMDDKEAIDIAYLVLEYADQLQNAAEVPAIPEPFSNDNNFLNYHKRAVELRKIVTTFANGDLSLPITMRGYIASACKNLQANLRHMIWKVQQVERGDYDQRIDFLGEFSTSFNNMVEKLATTIDDLHQKEEALTALAVSLQKEARRRSEALQELKKSEQRFKELAQRDPLTNLLNRRSFFTFAETSVQSASTLQEHCCVCLLDVDYFKQFNDTFGHLEGDIALQHVTKHCLSTLRQSDIMGRYGGEEFVFLFSSMTAEEGYIAADRIRLAVENNPFPLSSGKTTSLTVSIGVAVILPDEKTTDYAGRLRQGIAQADVALYEAKAQGRSRVCMASTPERK
jgi:diguanylate cyclase (GGDEF) domain